MKSRLLALAALIFALAGGGLLESALRAQEIVKAKPDSGANTSTFALNQPGPSSGRSGMELYWEGDKEHVFTVSPAQIQDPSTQNMGPSYQGQLSYSQEKSMGIQFGIPAFGSPESVEKAGRAGGSPGGIGGPAGPDVPMFPHR